MRITTSSSRKVMFSGILVALAGIISLVGSEMVDVLDLKDALLKLGLTLLVFGFMMTILGTGFYFLSKKGSSVFAVNLVFFYLGLGIIALPIFLRIFEITVTDPILMTIVIVTGILLALFGFFGEYAQLNQWFLQRIQIVVKLLVILRNRINWKLLLHPANALTLVSALIVVIWSQNLLTLDWWMVVGITFLLEITNLIIVFPELPRIIGVSILTFLTTLLEGLKWSLLHLDEMMHWTVEWLKKSFRRVFLVLDFLLQEKGIIVGVIGLAMLYFLMDVVTTLQLLVMFVFVFLISILLVVLQHPSLGQDIIIESRATVFKVKTRIQVRRNRQTLRSCYQCSLQLHKPYPAECPSCSAPQYSCMICNGLIDPSSVVVCPHCQTPAHPDHLLDWLNIKPKCPHCRRPLQSEGVRSLKSESLKSGTHSIPFLT